MLDGKAFQVGLAGPRYDYAEDVRSQVAVFRVRARVTDQRHMNERVIMETGEEQFH